MIFDTCSWDAWTLDATCEVTKKSTKLEGSLIDSFFKKHSHEIVNSGQPTFSVNGQKQRLPCLQHFRFFQENSLVSPRIKTAHKCRPVSSFAKVLKKDKVITKHQESRLVKLLKFLKSEKLLLYSNLKLKTLNSKQVWEAIKAIQEFLTQCNAMRANRNNLSTVKFVVASGTDWTEKKTKGS